MPSKLPQDNSIQHSDKSIPLSHDVSVLREEVKRLQKIIASSHTAKSMDQSRFNDQSHTPLGSSSRRSVSSISGASSHRSASSASSVSSSKSSSSSSSSSSKSSVKSIKATDFQHPFTHQSPQSRASGKSTSISTQVRRLIKDLNLKDSFYPRHERAYDDQLDLLERLTRAKGYDVSLLPKVITSLAEDNVLYRINKKHLYRIQDITKFRDKLAKALYPFSNEIDVIASELSSPDDREDAEELIMWFEKKVARYHLLRRRWHYPNAFHSHQLKQALLNKLSSTLAAEAMRSNWREWTVDKLSQFILKCHDDLTRRKRMAPAKTVIMATIDQSMEDNDYQLALRTPSRSAPNTPEAETPPRPRVCRWCKDPNHLSRECPSKPTCQTCGKTGHTPDQCYKAVHHGKLASQTITLTHTPKGLKVDMKEDTSNLAVLDSLSKHFTQAAQRVREAKERAEAKKEANVDTVIATVEGQAGGLYGTFNIGDTLVKCLIDPGADRNCMSWNTFMRLPNQHKIHWVSSEDLSDEHTSTLEFLAGAPCRVKGIVTLPIISTLGNVEQEFCIIEDARIDLLGNPWMRAVGAAVCFKNEELSNEIATMPLATRSYIQSYQAFEVQDHITEIKNITDVEACFDPSLDEHQREEIVKILKEYPSVWAKSKVACSKNHLYHIDTANSAPVVTPHRHYSPATLQEITTLTRQLLEAGAIRRSTSAWLSQPVLVRKKDGSPRLCVDYRPLNAVTVADPYQAPAASAVMATLGHASRFIQMDLKNSFNQVKLHPSDAHKTAFWTPMGQMEWTCVPFGLLNGTAAMARFLYVNLIDIDGVVVYVDDIVIYGDSVADILKKFRRVLKRLEEIGACINVKKCNFGSTMIEFLGYCIGAGVVLPPQESIKAIQNIKVPADTTQVRRFLGMIGYFRHFIKHFAVIAAPLYEVLHKDVPFQMSHERIKAINELKSLLAKSPQLTNPHPDWEYVLDTDASTTAIGAVLLQRDQQGILHPVRFGSRRLSPSERNWPIYELEGFAIVFFVLSYRPYLIGRHFTIRSDHKPLQWLWKIDKPRLARWSMALQQFDFTIVYNPGTAQEHVDIFTRDVEYTKADEFVDKHLPFLGPVSVKQRVSEMESNHPDAIQVERIPITTRSQVSTKHDCLTHHEVPFPNPTEFITELSKLSEPPKDCVKTEDYYVHKRSGTLFVPESLRGRILFCFHYTRIGAHRGAQKMIRVLSKYFYWPFLPKDCVDFTAGCLTCQRRANHITRLGHGVLLSTNFNVVVSIDAVGPFHHAQKSYTLITMIDNLTKWVEVAILDEAKAERTWQLFYGSWISRLGAPVKVITDGGGIFTGNEFVNKIKSFGISISTSSPHHPQGNSMIESFHHYLNNAVSRTSATSKWSFQEILSTVLMAYRSTPHISTGETPYKLLTGNDMVLPHFQEWTSYEALERRAQDRYATITILRQEAFQAAIQRTAAGKNKVDNRKFETGDVIIHELHKKDCEKLVRYFGGEKLMPKWSEPMRITKFVNRARDTFLVESVWHKNLKRQVHKTQVKHFSPMPDPQFNEWYKRESQNDRIYHKEPTKEELERRRKEEEQMLSGQLRDEHGRFVKGERSKEALVERDTHDWLYPKESTSTVQECFRPPTSDLTKVIEAQPDDEGNRIHRKRRRVHIGVAMLPTLTWSFPPPSCSLVLNSSRLSQWHSEEYSIK